MVSVFVFGKASYATNRVKVRVFVRNSEGEYTQRAQTISEEFGSGDFSLGSIVGTHQGRTDTGADIRIDAQLQRQSGSHFANLGSSVSVYPPVIDKYCRGRCAVTVSSTDKARPRATITLAHAFRFMVSPGRPHRRRRCR